MRLLRADDDFLSYFPTFKGPRGSLDIRYPTLLLGLALAVVYGLVVTMSAPGPWWAAIIAGLVIGPVLGPLTSKRVMRNVTYYRPLKGWPVALRAEASAPRPAPDRWHTPPAVDLSTLRRHQ